MRMHKAICSLLIVAWYAAAASAHTTSINVYVKPGTTELAVFPNFGFGTLESAEGSVPFTTEPGIQVSGPENGVGAGTELHVNVIGGLLYWNGTNLASSDSTLALDRPVGGGSSAVEIYQIEADSEFQTGMFWGTYVPPSSSEIWDEHGFFVLEGSNPLPGIYGIALQVAAPGLVSSEPFLVPLLYEVNAVGLSDASLAMLQAIGTLSAADFNRNTVVDQADLAIWHSSFGAEVTSPGLGDATGDGNVAGEDFLVWQTALSVGQAQSIVASIIRLPEPSLTVLLGWLGLIFLSSARM